MTGKILKKLYYADTDPMQYIEPKGDSEYEMAKDEMKDQHKILEKLLDENQLAEVHKAFGLLGKIHQIERAYMFEEAFKFGVCLEVEALQPILGDTENDVESALRALRVMKAGEEESQ